MSEDEERMDAEGTEEEPDVEANVPEGAAPLVFAAPSPGVVIGYRAANGADVGPDGRCPEELVAGIPWAYRAEEGYICCLLCHRRRGRIIGRLADLQKHEDTPTHRRLSEALRTSMEVEERTADTDSERGVEVSPQEAEYFSRLRAAVSGEMQGKPCSSAGLPRYSCDFLPRRAIVLSNLAGTSWSRHRRVRRLVSHVRRNHSVSVYVALFREFWIYRCQQFLLATHTRMSLRLARGTESSDGSQSDSDVQEAAPNMPGMFSPGFVSAHTSGLVLCSCYHL